MLYETEERAMAPGIADGWPKIIPAPHTKNGRLKMLPETWLHDRERAAEIRECESCIKTIVEHPESPVTALQYRLAALRGVPFEKRGD